MEVADTIIGSWVFYISYGCWLVQLAFLVGAIWSYLILFAGTWYDTGEEQYALNGFTFGGKVFNRRSNSGC